MEEHKDLDLTVAVFKRVLDKPDLASLTAGLALQAYLPLGLRDFRDAFVFALVIAYFAMPVFWHLPFLLGLQWNAATVRWWLGLVGLVAGFAAQGVTVFIPHTKELPIEEIFHNPALIWFLAVFGVVIAGVVAVEGVVVVAVAVEVAE